MIDKQWITEEVLDAWWKGWNSLDPLYEIKIRKPELENLISLAISEAEQHFENEQNKDNIFINHIQRHLDEMGIDGKVICKICGKSAEQVYKEVGRGIEVIRETKLLNQIRQATFLHFKDKHGVECKCQID